MVRFVKVSNSSSVSIDHYNENICLLWNPKFLCRAHKSAQLSASRFTRNSAHTITFYSCKIPLNIFIISLSNYPVWSRPLKVSNQNFLWFSQCPHASYMPRLSRFPWFDQPNSISQRVWGMMFLIKTYESTQPYRLTHKHQVHHRRENPKSLLLFDLSSIQVFLTSLCSFR